MRSERPDERFEKYEGRKREPGCCVCGAENCGRVRVILMEAGTSQAIVASRMLSFCEGHAARAFDAVEATLLEAAHDGS
jgi:hypothetical protein